MPALCAPLLALAGPREDRAALRVEAVRVSEADGRSIVVITTSGKPTFTTFKLGRRRLIPESAVWSLIDQLSDQEAA